MNVIVRRGCPTIRSTRSPRRRGSGLTVRWAAESNMGSERNRSRHQRDEHRGANIVRAWSIAAVCNIASQLRSPRAAVLRNVTVAPSVAAPSLGAQLRSSAHQKVTCISTQTSLPCSRIAVESQASSSRPSASVQSGSLPNNRLVPTANRLAPVGSHRACAAPAAQPQRWA